MISLCITGFQHVFFSDVLGFVEIRSDGELKTDGWREINFMISYSQMRTQAVVEFSDEKCEYHACSYCSPFTFSTIKGFFQLLMCTQQGQNTLS